MRRYLLFSIAWTAATAAAQASLHVKLIDIVKIQGADAHTIFGMGLVTGLKGTGDSSKAVREQVVNFMRRMGYNRTASDIATGSVAMVMVKATVPPFAKPGNKLDVTVSTINDASSLHGGILELTLLRAASGLHAAGEVHGMASGRIFVGGASYGTAKASVTRNHPTVGTVIGGCRLTTAPKTSYLNDAGHLELRLLNPSTMTVTSAVDSVNQRLAGSGARAEIVDESMLRIRFAKKDPTHDDAVRLLSHIHDVPVATGQRAKVLIDESTGIILAGQGVQISPCAFAVGDVHISIISQQEVSQPGPGFSRGTTEKVNRTRVEVTAQNSAPQAIKGGATVEELVRNLAALNLTPLQLIAVFQKLRSGGYLHAELEYK
ncbi:MAG: flagellar basal body P-ring protein FlgI [Planctomycetes bacterium]|nr:flagellar basal body P-ring protein FlgI [Planctomycetota bacterium]MCB9871987.1 flagellar basal body P-ring protein FlgI [Planctomycetota bacterium]MCB9888392.1 flagellar basal body P-ring protein FlgI [Planctomycetota bacterium]